MTNGERSLYNRYQQRRKDNGVKTTNEIIEKSELKRYLQDAKGIAFDTCHKIYVLMDEEQMVLMRQYGYDPLITSGEMSPDEMYERITEWFDQSCGLRFIEAVQTNPEDPNEGFISIVSQFEDDEDEGE